jgi:uncharacterized protein with FMN-binding domain
MTRQDTAVRKAAVAILVTVVAVVLLASYDTHPPRTVNPNAARRPQAARPAPRHDPHVRTAAGPALTTPFSVVQVQATLTRGRLTGVRTLALSGNGPHTAALNARAEPILREEALRAGSAHIDAVSGATYTSRVWIQSLRKAIAAARR